jgi:hypothetical protein
MGTMAGDGQGGMNANIDVGFGEGYGDLNSEFEQQMMNGNPSNYVPEEMG